MARLYDGYRLKFCLTPRAGLRRLLHKRFVVSCFVIVTLCLSGSSVSAADEKSYWLTNGYSKTVACPGSRDGKPLRVVNKDGQWVLITGVVLCRDSGNTYSYEVRFLGVQVNPGARLRINRNQLAFDWIGLAIYQPAINDRKVKWLYDENRPLEGMLNRSGNETIYFGGMTFTVEKAAVNAATHFTFYMTSEGVLYTFGVL